MSEITLTINSRNYDVACDDGQEDHLRELAAHIDERIQELARSIGQVGESRLLVMTSLLIADELYDAYREIHSLKSGAAPAEARDLTGLEVDGVEITAALDACASRLERLAQRLAEN